IIARCLAWVSTRMKCCARRGWMTQPLPIWSGVVCVWITESRYTKENRAAEALASEQEQRRMTQEDLLVRRDGAVLTLTLNRPDQRNALNDVMLKGLTEQL